MIFESREQAAELLSEKLTAYKGAVVLGIPRGGVVLAKVIAEKLRGKLDVILARKLASPINPELAIGAVSENGEVVLNLFMEVSKEYLNSEIAKQKEVIKKRLALFSAKRPSLKNQVVIIVDDGIATGATVKAAVRDVKKQGAKKVIVATPVGAPDTIEELRKEVDVICLYAPQGFEAVGEFYRYFDQVTDEEVKQLLFS